MKLLDNKNNILKEGDIIKIHSLRDYSKCKQYKLIYQGVQLGFIGIKGIFTALENMPTRAIERV